MSTVYYIPDEKIDTLVKVIAALQNEATTLEAGCKQHHKHLEVK